MLDSLSAFGFFVHTPLGPRKSGMPESVEIPAPVSTTMRSASATQVRAASWSSMPPVSRTRPGFPFRGRPDTQDRHPTSSRPTTDPAREVLVPTDPPPLPPTVRITPWIDPVVDRRGHDPRSTYVEQFWLSILGPTSTWIMRRLVAGFDDHPDGYELDVDHAARALGLSVAKGTASPFARSIQRCVVFGMAAPRSDGWTVRRRMPPISQRHLGRLPEPLQRRH